VENLKETTSKKLDLM